MENNYIKIEDEFRGYELSQFCIVKHYEKDLESVLIPHGMIKDRIEKLALDISNDEEMSKSRIIALCVLKGGFKFFADLMDAIDKNNRNATDSIPVRIEFIKVRSYVNTESSGNVQISGLDDLESLRDQRVLIVEDIIDSGRTISRLLEYLQQFHPKCIKVASLLVKRTPQGPKTRPDFVGFEIPNKFIVGYALDYNDHFRDLSHICAISDDGQRKYSVHKP